MSVHLGRRPLHQGPPYEGSSLNLAILRPQGVSVIFDEVLSPVGTSVASWARGSQGPPGFPTGPVHPRTAAGGIQLVEGRAQAAPSTLVTLTDSREETEAREVILKGKRAASVIKNVKG